jgi:hypothetical protein
VVGRREFFSHTCTKGFFGFSNFDEFESQYPEKGVFVFRGTRSKQPWPNDVSKNRCIPACTPACQFSPSLVDFLNVFQVTRALRCIGFIASRGYATSNLSGAKTQSCEPTELTPKGAPS